MAVLTNYVSLDDLSTILAKRNAAAAAVEEEEVAEVVEDDEDEKCVRQLMSRPGHH